jgi:serine/threonine protein phosphatase PrpC
MEDCVFCGVFDGHGQYGHVVAKKVRDAFPLKIMNEWNSRCRYDDNNNNKNNNHFKIMRESFVKASKSMDRELKQQHSMDSYGSGTTAVTLIKKVCTLFHLISLKKKKNFVASFITHYFSCFRDKN